MHRLHLIGAGNCADQQTVIDIQNVLADVCQRGYADRAAIWNELTPSEQTAYRARMATKPANLLQKISG